MRKIFQLFSIITIIGLTFAFIHIRANVEDWKKQHLLAIDNVESATQDIPYSADILSFYYDFCDEKIALRIGMVSLQSIPIEPRQDLWKQDNISLEVEIRSTERSIILRIQNNGEVQSSDGIQAKSIITVPCDMIEIELDNIFSQEECKALEFSARAYSWGRFCDEIFASAQERMDPGANCALMHHGNQALAYTNVFRGRSEDLDGSGFDEVLEAHDAHNIPVCIHMGGLLQTSAAWDDPAFNAWINIGISEGWIDMIGSAYAQHIMPFVTDNMNSWAVYIHRQLTHNYYGYWTKVAWVPERLFLDGPGGRYPNAGVADWLGDDFEDNDIDAVILDDNVHCTGYDNHQIHNISGTGLKVIPRDNDFTGRLHAGDGAGALAILTGLSGSGVGDYRIAVYADDWEMAAEMGEWASSMPNAKETYDWFVNKCWVESSWLHTWKLTDAIVNPNFTGTTMTFTPGTHPSIGGADGYGGGNNGWYTHWAGYSSPSDHHSPQWNFGYIWNDAQSNLSSGPDNNISQAGWYVLMTNLYETGWHDGMGGPISGWQMKFSTHIKNANVYALGARWAAGLLTPAVRAYFEDADHDGDNELIIYNQRIFAVFEGIGGRAVWIFAKSGTNNATIVGNCNTYWEGTEGDYNDANHIAALSDVGVGGFDYEHALYDWEISSSTTDSAVIILRHDQVRKRISLRANQPYLRCEYFTRDKTTFIKTGFTPDLVSMIWNPDIQRIWSAGEYAGFRNNNNSAIGAYIMGDGGARHSAEFRSTLLRGDEVVGVGTFGFYLCAGWETATSSGTVATFDALAAGLTDVFPPDAYKAYYNMGTDMLVIFFTDTINISMVNLASIGFDQNADGTVDVWLNTTCMVENTVNEDVLRIHLSASKATAVEALSTTNLILALNAGAVRDVGGIQCRQLRNGPDQVPIRVQGNLKITIDGYLDPDEWFSWTNVINDPNTDSEWGITLNEIWGVHLYWDSLHCYFAINGIHETTPNDNAWLLYIDKDHGGPGGVADLRNIDHWDRNALFTTGSGFKCDYQFGSYTGWTGDLWKILTATTSVLETTDAWYETDLTSPNPCSEIAIAWNTLYGLGAGRVPNNARIALKASIASDENLGGDCAPNNISSVLPTMDSVKVFLIDADGNGYPDDCYTRLPILEQDVMKIEDFSISAAPNPFNSALRLSVISKSASDEASISIYDISGKTVANIFNGVLQNGENVFVWDGRDTFGKEVESGLYFVRLQVGEHAFSKKLALVR